MKEIIYILQRQKMYLQELENADVYIYIDVINAMKDGIKFYESSNYVVTRYIKNGIIPEKYFSKVEFENFKIEIIII